MGTDPGASVFKAGGVPCVVFGKNLDGLLKHWTEQNKEGFFCFCFWFLRKIVYKPIM